MNKKESNKTPSILRKYFWEIFLVVLAAILSFVIPLVYHRFFPTKTSSSDTVIFNMGHDHSGTINPTAPRHNKNVFVDVEISANSNDVILINGKEAVYSDQSTTSKSVKLIKGKRYLVKIGNCPESEITPVKDTLLSRCPNF